MPSPRQNGSRLRPAAVATRSSPATSAPRSLPRPVSTPTRAFPSWTPSRRTLSPMGMFFHAASEPPERAADPAVRRANLRRIGPLFKPYKLRLGGVLLLIVASAGLGVVPAFLLKHVLEAIARNDTRDRKSTRLNSSHRT